MPTVVWTPQPGPQHAFCTCPYEEVLYGGSAGGGKSDALLGDWTAGVERDGGAWRGVIFRRYYPDLEELQRRSIEILGPVYGTDCFKRGTGTWEIPTAKGVATLKLSAMNAREDVYKHQGHQYSWIGWDELTQWESDWWYEYLITRLRSPKGATCYLRAATNPGGVGHNWVRDRWKIGEQQPMAPFKAEVAPGVFRTRVFIPAKLSDNRILEENDPAYRTRLEAMADPVMRRALLDGDWNIIAGAAFSEWRGDVHVVPTHQPPPGVKIIRSMDWGYKKPYGCLWAYINYDGDVVVCRELYGQGSKLGMGSEEDEEIVLEKIRDIERENEWHVTEAYLDPQCWAEMGGGMSIAEKLGGYKMAWRPWPKGPNSRVAQKKQVHTLLRVINNRSRLVFMDCCHHTIRTIPTIQVSPTNIEDVDTDGEDHLYDALRGIASIRIPSKNEIDALEKARQVIALEDQAEGMGRYMGGW